MVFLELACYECSGMGEVCYILGNRKHRERKWKECGECSGSGVDIASVNKLWLKEYLKNRYNNVPDKWRYIGT